MLMVFGSAFFTDVIGKASNNRHIRLSRLTLSEST
jgi:hypothetical protein